jgi:predicted metal-binding protein
MNMVNKELEKYCKHALGNGAAHAKPIHPSSVVTAAWVRLKCQFGCPLYGLSHCCPPHTPTPDQTRQIIDSYHRALLFHLEAPKKPGREKRFGEFFEMLIDLEGEVFKDGFYKAFVFLSGPCHICKDCASLQGKPCNFGYRARPAMEACGMDVFQTARNNGFFIQTLSKRTETQNHFSLMLVD